MYCSLFCKVVLLNISLARRVTCDWGFFFCETIGDKASIMDICDCVKVILNDLNLKIVFGRYNPCTVIRKVFAVLRVVEKNNL